MLCKERETLKNVRHQVFCYLQGKSSIVASSQKHVPSQAPFFGKLLGNVLHKNKGQTKEEEVTVLTEQVTQQHKKDMGEISSTLAIQVEIMAIMHT